MALWSRQTGCRLQTTASCWGGETLVVSVAEKAHEMCQVWTKKVSDERTSGSVERLNDDVETGGSTLSQDKSSGWPVFLAGRHPAYSWHELGPGSFVERGNPARDAKGEPITAERERGEYRCP